jgi:hypothetical protein
MVLKAFCQLSHSSLAKTTKISLSSVKYIRFSLVVQEFLLSLTFSGFLRVFTELGVILALTAGIVCFKGFFLSTLVFSADVFLS